MANSQCVTGQTAMRDSNRKGKRPRNAGISPWNIEESIDYTTDFVQHCCGKSMTRLPKCPPQKCKRKTTTTEKEVDDEREVAKGKSNFISKLCPNIDDKEKFMLDFNCTMESADEANNKQTTQQQRWESNDTNSFERRRDFEEKVVVWKRARTSDDFVPTAMMTSLFGTTHARSRSTPSWKGDDLPVSYDDMRQMIDAKVRSANEATSKHIWELANLFCSSTRPGKIHDEKAMLLLNQELTSANTNSTQLYKKIDPVHVNDLEMEEKRRNRKTKDVDSNKKGVTKMMVILPSISYNGEATDDEYFKNFPSLPTFKMMINAMKHTPQQQNQPPPINEDSIKTVIRDKSNVQLVNFPKLTVNSHNFNPKPSEICRKHSRNLKAANVDPPPTQQVLVEDNNMKYEKDFLQNPRRWNGAVGSLYSKPMKTVPKHYHETTKKIDKNSPANKFSDVKAANLLFLK